VRKTMASVFAARKGKIACDLAARDAHPVAR
jgi:hypothetical protein